MPIRYTKDEAAEMKQKALEDALNNVCEENKEEEVVDAFSLSDPQDVLSEFTAEWAENLVSLKKW